MCSAVKQGESIESFPKDCPRDTQMFDEAALIIFGKPNYWAHVHDKPPFTQMWGIMRQTIKAGILGDSSEVVRSATELRGMIEEEAAKAAEDTLNASMCTALRAMRENKLIGWSVADKIAKHPDVFINVMGIELDRWQRDRESETGLAEPGEAGNHHLAKSIRLLKTFWLHMNQATGDKREVREIPLK